MADHDLLIRIDARLGELALKVDDHHKEKNVRWEELSREKADRSVVEELVKRVDDHEKRTRFLESWLWRGVGLAIAVNLMVGMSLAILQLVIRK